MNSQLMRAEVLYTAGWIYYVKGLYEDSLTHFLDALTIYREENDYGGEGKSLMGNGLVIQAIDRHREAISIFNKVLNLYDLHELEEKKASVYINLSISYIEQKNLTKLNKYWNKRGFWLSDFS